MKYFVPVLLILISGLVGCRSTKKAYERGDYDTAVVNSIERLRRSPNNKKSRETLKQAYPALVDYMLEQVDMDKLSSNPLRWEKVARHYKLLNQVYDEIRRSPAASDVIRNPQEFQDEYNSATLNAAEARYALGTQKLGDGERGNREAAKEAYTHFGEALRWRKNFRDAERLMADAREYATLYILVENIPMHSRSLELTNEFFDNQIFEYISSQTFSPFVQFMSPKDAAGRSRAPDQIVRMMFDDFVVGQSFVKERVLQRSRDSVKVGEVQINQDSVAPAYGTVKAEVHRFTKELSSSGLLDVRIIDGRSGSIVSQRKFPGTFVWYDYWGFFNGDDRALDADDDQWMRKSREIPNPLPQDLFIEFTKPIFSQTTRFLTDYYGTI